jgi:hypothetical protein
MTAGGAPVVTDVAGAAAGAVQGDDGHREGDDGDQRQRGEARGNRPKVDRAGAAVMERTSGFSRWDPGA